MSMKISLAQFITELLGARYLDKFRWRALNMERALVDQFAYDDTGATYISPMAKAEYTSKKAGVSQ